MLTDYTLELTELLSKSKLIDICQYHKKDIINKNLNFNIFRLISNQFRKENFHSDVLAVLLDPHILPEGNIFLSLFLEFLSNEKIKIESKNFTQATVEREKHRIDILIKSHNSAVKQAIIIENKINNATDTYRQLPTYYNRLVSEGYEVVAIIYLILDINKTPVQEDWKADEITIISNKLVHIPAYSGMPDDLYSGWLKQCETKAYSPDGLCLIRHYADLLKHISRNIMDIKALSEFQPIARENFDTLRTTNQLWAQLPKYYAYKITQYYKNNCLPFKKAWVYKDTASVFDDFILDGHKYAIDIYCSNDSLTLFFFERAAEGKLTDSLYLIINRLGLTEEFIKTDSGFKKKFQLPTGEDELNTFLPRFFGQLGSLLDNSSVE